MRKLRQKLRRERDGKSESRNINSPQFHAGSFERTLLLQLLKTTKFLNVAKNITAFVIGLILIDN